MSARSLNFIDNMDNISDLLINHIIPPVRHNTFLILQVVYYLDAIKSCNEVVVFVKPIM